jgi:hypothetical protein
VRIAVTVLLVALLAAGVCSGQEKDRNTYGGGSYPGSGGGGAAAPTDTIPPTAPTGLTAVAGSDSVYLYWNAPVGARTYTVYRDTTASPTTALTTTLTVPYYVDYTVAEATTYYYAVSATDRAGEGDKSADLEVQTSSDSNPALAAPYPELIEGDGVIYVSWDGVTGAASYNVYRGTVSGSLSLLSNTAATAYADQSVTNGVTYYYALSTINSVDIEGSLSSEVSGVPTAYVSPSVSSFSIVDLDQSQVETVDIAYLWSANKDVTYRSIYWYDNQTEPSAAAFPWQPYSSDYGNEQIETVIPWPTADADSTVRVSWTAGDPAPDHYILDGRYNDGSWAQISNAISADSTGYTHTASDTPAVSRGKWEYRLYAVSAAGDSSDVATPDGALFNDAIQVKSRLYVTDGTNYAQSAVSSRIEVNPDATAPDTTPPDTTGVFQSVAFDTSSGGLAIDMSLIAAEPVRANQQWKLGYNGTWAPVTPSLQPASANDTISISVNTSGTLAALDGDTLYSRFRIADTVPNYSSYVGPIRKVFNRASEAGGDTVLYVFSVSSTGYSLSDLGSVYRFITPAGDTIYSPRAYAVTTSTANTGYLDPQYPDSVWASLSGWRLRAANDLPLTASGNSEAGIVYYDTADSLLGMTVIDAAHEICATAFSIPANVLVHNNGITDSGMAVWASSAGATFNEYDPAGDGAWSPTLDTYANWTEFTAGDDSLLITSAVTTYGWASLPAEKAAQAWADGDPVGGFWIMGEHATGATMGFYNAPITQAYRPVFWVLGVK